MLNNHFMYHLDKLNMMNGKVDISKYYHFHKFHLDMLINIKINISNYLNYNLNSLCLKVHYIKNKNYDISDKHFNYRCNIHLDK